MTVKAAYFFYLKFLPEQKIVAELGALSDRRKNWREYINQISGFGRAEEIDS
jgi:hypothetical protein